MSPSAIMIGKLMVSVVWLLIIVAVIAPATLAFQTLLQSIGALLVVAHSVELLVYRHMLANPSDYIATLLFGLLHIKSISVTRKLSL